MLWEVRNNVKKGVVDLNTSEMVKTERGATPCRGRLHTKALSKTTRTHSNSSSRLHLSAGQSRVAPLMWLHSSELEGVVPDVRSRKEEPDPAQSHRNPRITLDKAISSKSHSLLFV